MNNANLNERDVVIVAASRTPMGSLQGALSGLTAPQLGSSVLRSVLAKSGLPSQEVDEVLMGNVLSAGVGQAPARQAALGAGLCVDTPCTTVSKVCGSGMKAVMLGIDQIRSGGCEVVLAGGMESMSNAPYFLAKARDGMRLGHGQIMDHMFFDGLEDAYTGRAMGSFAQETANQHDLSREAMDNYALESLRRAQEAISSDKFSDEVIPVSVPSRTGEIQVSQDEQPGKAKPEKIPLLKPAFAKEGTITAANSSSISDGAAALLLMSSARAQELGLSAIARVVGHASHAQSPEEFTVAPIGSIKKLFAKIRWNTQDIDLFEINEAFAMVTMLALKELDLDHGKVNVNGGACALGHPIGASGARILVTLLHALRARKLSKGIASLCIGGGEATAIAVELL